MVTLDKWEHIEDTEGRHVYRHPVPGGWLVAMTVLFRSREGIGAGITFVPDPDHSWQDEADIGSGGSGGPKH